MTGWIPYFLIATGVKEITSVSKVPGGRDSGYGGSYYFRPARRPGWREIVALFVWSPLIFCHKKFNKHDCSANTQLVLGAENMTVLKNIIYSYRVAFFLLLLWLLQTTIYMHNVLYRTQIKGEFGNSKLGGGYLKNISFIHCIK